MFLLCHTPRIIVDVINIIKREKFVKCKPWLPSKNFKILIEVSEFTLILNSSLNFFVYCLIDETFRKEFHKFYSYIVKLVNPPKNSNISNIGGERRQTIKPNDQNIPEQIGECMHLTQKFTPEEI